MSTPLLTTATTPETVALPLPPTTMAGTVMATTTAGTTEMVTTTAGTTETTGTTGTV